MDLSKAFDSLPHDLIIAKLSAYGLSKKALKLLYSYLKQRQQRTKIESYFSEWLEIILGVPQGSILGPLLFNIFINDLFFIIKETDICNFADDNTIYSSAKSMDEVLNNLTFDLENIMKWFKLNHLVANPDKFQMMILGSVKQTLDLEKVAINVDGVSIKPTNEVKLLGISFDRELNFRKHIDDLCIRANRNIRCLARLRNYLNVHQSRLLYNAYIKPIFSYCPLIWMFCQRGSYQKIEKIQVRSLRIVLDDYKLLLSNLTDTHKVISFHSQHIHSLLTEIFKTQHDLNPCFMKDLFKQKDVSFNLRTSNLLDLPKGNTVKYGSNSVFFRGALIWNSIPDKIKEVEKLRTFKSKLLDLGISCTCKICKM